jgi:hypothetical protein
MEFTICSFALIPLTLGVFVFGFKLIRSLQMQQIVRDLGHMYEEGADFTNTGTVSVAQQLASGYALTSTGHSEVILSQISLVQQADCDAGNPTHPTGQACTNLNLPTFAQQVILGNSSDGTSNYGTPPVQSSTYLVTAADRANNTAAQAVGFSSVLALQTGETAYVAEMINLTPEFNITGFPGKPLIYARAIF